MARLARAILTLVLICTLAGSAFAVARIVRDPLVRPLVERSAQGIAAATNQLMAREATPERIAALLQARLAEEPRNWLVIDALLDVAAERGLTLPPDLTARIDVARADDSGFWQVAGDCALCAYDPATCSLTLVMACQVPVALSPLGDVAGVARAGSAYATGGEIDEIDLALSVVGLGATALVLASGGSSALVKAGAGMAKLARRMGVLSPRLTALGVDAARRGVDWAALPAARSADDLARAVRMDAFAPVLAVVTDLGRVQGATGTATALHLLGHVDDAADARRLANAAEALGPKTLGRAEVLGKARFLRATLHWSEAVWQMLAGLGALLASGVALVAGAAQTVVLRLLRGATRMPR